MPASTIRLTKLGDLELRLSEQNRKYFGLAISDGSIKVKIEGDSADEVWRRLHDEAAKANPRYFGFDGARARFLGFFPDGFHSRSYTGEERDYKVKAKVQLDKNAPIGKALSSTGLGEAVLAVYRETNLLSPFEKVRLQDVLRGPNADSFIHAAARFTMGEGKSALLDMERALRPHDSAKWTVISYLPFLWRPDAHMYLKPEVTKDFASRVGHRFASDYEAKLDISVYESLLDLVQKTEIELAELKPRDRIDVQSFIWVIGGYKNEQQSQANS